MKKILPFFIFYFLFQLNCTNINAQTWEERSKNTGKKSLEEIGQTLNNESIDKLTKVIAQDENMLAKQAGKLAEIEELFKVNKNALGNNIKESRRLKLVLKEVKKLNPKSTQITTLSSQIKRLESQRSGLKSAWKKSLQKRNTYQAYVTNLFNKVEKNKGVMRLLSKTGNIISKNEAVAAGGGTLGEVAAWLEGNSSFRNVIIRATKEGSKAVVSISTGIVVGTVAAANTWNPYLTGASAVASTVYMEEKFDKTAGKYFDKLMDREHLAINKYKADPDDLFKIREAKRKKAFEEDKKQMKDIMDKQDEYKAELERYINERNAIWAQFEEDMKKQAEEEYKLKSLESPTIVQKANKTRIKPGETVTITVETTGGLLPITYSGMLDYTVKTGYERYLVSYKWTPDKKTGPGVYDFTITATSHSKKTGSHTLGIEVLDPNPAPKPQVKQQKRESDRERVYDARDLNIKKVPGEEVLRRILKVSGHYTCHFSGVPSDTKMQYFDVQLGANISNSESKTGIAHVTSIFGNSTIPLPAELVEELKKKYHYLPDSDIPKTKKVYFHLGKRYCKFDPATGRLDSELEGIHSPYDTYLPEFDITDGKINAIVKESGMSGTISFSINDRKYVLPFTGKR